MRSDKEVEAMLKAFDDVDISTGLDAEGNAIQEALSWVLGNRTDDDLRAYLPEED